MCLVDNDGKPILFVGRTDVRNYKRELFNRGDDDTLAIPDGIPQVTGVFCPRHGVCHLHELFNVITDLLIQNAAVGDHQNGIHHRMTVPLQAYQLMGQPCDRI